MNPSKSILPLSVLILTLTFIFLNKSILFIMYGLLAVPVEFLFINFKKWH